MATISSYGSGGGNWSNGSTWAGGSVPVFGVDDVIIVSGDTVTIDGTGASCGSDPGSGNDGLTVNGTLTFGTLTIQRTLKVRGDITVSSTGAITGTTSMWGANNYMGEIQIDGNGTDLKYELAVEDGGQFKLTYTGTQPARRTELASQASSGQAVLDTDDDMSAQGWQTGSTIIVGKHVHNSGDAEKGVISSYSGGNIVLTGNLSYTHDTDTGIYLLSRPWLIQPTSDSYRIKRVVFDDSTGTNIVSDNILFRGVGNTGSGNRGLTLSPDWNGSLDYCAVEGVGPSNPYSLWLENYFTTHTFSNWLFYLTRGLYCVGSGDTDYTFDSCYWVRPSTSNDPVLNGGTKTYNHFVDCIFDSSPTNGNFLGAGNKRVSTLRCRFRACYQAIRLYDGTVSFQSKDDVFELNTTYWALYGTNNYGDGVFISPTFSSGTLKKTNPTPGSFLKVHEWNCTPNDHRWYDSNYGILQTSGSGLDDTTTKTTGTFALRGSVLTAGKKSSFKFTKAVEGDDNIVLYGYMRKNSSYGSSTLPTVKLESADGEIDTSATMADVNNSWERFSVDGAVGSNPTYITITLEFQSSSTSAVCYFADMGLVVGQGDSTTGYGVGTLWKEGTPTVDEGLGGNIDQEYLRTAVWDADMTSDFNTEKTAGRLLKDIRLRRP